MWWQLAITSRLSNVGGQMTKGKILGMNEEEFKIACMKAIAMAKEEQKKILKKAYELENNKEVK